VQGTFVVVNGDVLTDVDISGLVAFHRRHGAAATIHLTAVDDPSRFGVVPVDHEDRVVSFIEKPPPGGAPTNLINAGTYVLEPEVLERIPRGRRASIERETFPALAVQGVLYAQASDAYWLDIGNALGGNTYYQSGNLGEVLTTKTVSGLPTNGSAIYVTLYSLIGGVWTYNSYTYTAFNAASAAGVLTTPAPSSILTANNVTFDWTAGTNASNYWLDVGNVAGGNQWYQSGNLGNVLTTTAPNLPANGSTLYATLYSYVGGQWVKNSYTYTAAPGAVITTPAPGSTVTGTSATFNWSAGTGFTSYNLTVGSTYGGSDIYSSGSITALTATVTTLPANSSTIYVTLYSVKTGETVQNYYSYSNP
jgi:hypothetical protein